MKTLFGKRNATGTSERKYVRMSISYTFGESVAKLVGVTRRSKAWTS